MSERIRGFRGATTLEEDSPEHLSERMGELYRAVVEKNSIDDDDVISVFLTSTPDVKCMFVAEALRRAVSIPDVPLLGAQEHGLEGWPPFSIRIMVHAYSNLSRTDVVHVFLHGAKDFRRDLKQ